MWAAATTTVAPKINFMGLKTEELLTALLEINNFTFYTEHIFMWLYINITIDIFLPLISHGTISKYV
jgi:hypothetical protein